MTENVRVIGHWDLFSWSSLGRGKGGDELLDDWWAILAPAGDGARATADVPADALIALKRILTEDAAEPLLVDASLKPDVVLLAEGGDSIPVLLDDVIGKEDDLGLALEERLDDAVESLGDSAGAVDLLETIFDGGRSGFRHKEERPRQTVANRHSHRNGVGRFSSSKSGNHSPTAGPISVKILSVRYYQHTNNIILL